MVCGVLLVFPSTLRPFIWVDTRHICNWDRASGCGWRPPLRFGAHGLLPQLGMQMGRIDLLRPWENALAEGNGNLGGRRTCCNAVEQISGTVSFQSTHTHTHIHQLQLTETHRRPVETDTIVEHKILYTPLRKLTFCLRGNATAPPKKHRPPDSACCTAHMLFSTFLNR